MTLFIRAKDKFVRPPDALFLDLDNTLYPYDPSHRAALEQVRAKAMRLVSMASSDFDALYTRARREVKDRVGATAASHSRLLYFQRLIELAGLKTQVLTALDLEQTYWRSFLTQARLFDDVLEFLDDMRGFGNPIVIVTNLTAQIQFRKIVHFGLDHYIDYVVTSEEAGTDKPAAAPFELALEKIGATPDSVWIIGDDPHDMAVRDLVPNAVTIQKLHAGVKYAEAGADASFEHFADLRRMLARYRSGFLALTRVASVRRDMQGV